jgi:hypothetical protein
MPPSLANAHTHLIAQTASFFLADTKENGGTSRRF